MELCHHSQDDELSVLDKRVVALSLLSKLPVISFCCNSTDALPAAAAATGDTWPVFFTPHPHEDVRPMAEVRTKARRGSGRMMLMVSVDRTYVSRLGACHTAWCNAEMLCCHTACALQWLREELPRVRALSAAITEEVQVGG